MSDVLAWGIVLAALIVLRSAARRRAGLHRRRPDATGESPATHAHPAEQPRTDRPPGERR